MADRNNYAVIGRLFSGALEDLESVQSQLVIALTQGAGRMIASYEDDVTLLNKEISRLTEKLHAISEIVDAGQELVEKLAAEIKVLEASLLAHRQLLSVVGLTLSNREQPEISRAVMELTRRLETERVDLKKIHSMLLDEIERQRRERRKSPRKKNG